MYIWYLNKTPSWKLIVCRNVIHKQIFPPSQPPPSLTDPFCRVIDQLWTSVGHFITHLLTTNIEPLIQKSLEGFSLKDFKFDHVLLGKGQKMSWLSVKGGKINKIKEKFVFSFEIKIKYHPTELTVLKRWKSFSHFIWKLHHLHRHRSIVLWYILPRNPELS